MACAVNVGLLRFLFGELPRCTGAWMASMHGGRRGSLDGLCWTWDVEFGASLRGYTVVLSSQAWRSVLRCAVSFLLDGLHAKGFFLFRS